MVPAGGEMQNTLLDVIQSFLYEPRHFIAIHAVPLQRLNV